MALPRRPLADDEMAVYMKGDPARRFVALTDNKADATKLVAHVLMRYLEAVDGEERGTRWAADLATDSAIMRARRTH